MQTNLVGYAKSISNATGIIDPTKLEMIENYMRNIYFHSTLDWVDEKTFDKGARESATELQILNWQFI